MRAGARRIALAATVAIVVATAAAFAVRRASGGPSDGGVSAGLSAMERLPAERSLPSAVVRWVESSAAATNTDFSEAKARVRKLRSNLGERHSDLYAYRTAGGGTCLDLTDQVALCPRDAQAGPRGIQWVTGGFESVPRNVAGLVSDEVVGVTLSTDGMSQVVPIRNNAVFAELPPAGETKLLVSFRDGSSETIGLPDER